MRIPQHVIDEIERKIDIVDVVSEYVNLEYRGSRYWGLSPFTNERTPSFTVTPEKNAYYCFSSSKGGGVFRFIMEMEHLTFPEAVEFLAGKAGVEFERGGDQDDGRRNEQQALQELYQRVSGSFHYIFSQTEKGKPARDYISRRAIPDTVAERYEIGFAPGDPDWLYRFLRKMQYYEEFLGRTGLFTRKNPRRALFRNRVMFPIRNHRGAVVGFGGRQLSDAGPKYINSPDSALFRKKELLYGLHESLREIRREGVAYLVEGYMDVLAFAAAELGQAVAPLGTAFTESQARLLRRFAGRVVLVFDADEAGLNATRRAADLLERAGLDCQVAPLPSGKDPGDILEEEGSRGLQNVLESREDVFEFLADRAVAQVDPESPEGKEFVLQLLFPYIRVVESAVKREAYLQIVADRLNVELQAVYQDFLNQESRGRATQSRPSQDTRVNTPDLFLMLLVAVQREYFSYVRKMLGQDQLEDPRARELYIALEESFRAGEESRELLMERVESEELRALLAEKTNTDEFSLNPGQAVTDTVHQIKKRSLQKQIKEIQAEIRHAEAKGSGYSQQEVDELQQEILYLNGELNKLG